MFHDTICEMMLLYYLKYGAQPNDKERREMIKAAKKLCKEAK